jgi:hypothetical protein
VHIVAPMNVRPWLLLAGLLAFLGCQQSKEESVTPGRAVAATDLCTELATIACETDKTCCTSSNVAAPSDAGPDVAAPADAGPVESCADTQLRRCRATLGRLLDDPRLAYVPERGGKLVDAVRAAAKTCWATPIRYDDVAAIFAGSGAVGTDCTPPEINGAELRSSSLSCAGDAACRLYLASDGTNEAACEARTETNADACSHAFDCGAARFCKLPNDWKPGLWGRCQPLRGEGWQCTSGRECESGFCGDDAKCGRRSQDQICLATGYRTIVLADAPVAYLRLGDAEGTSSASDASGGSRAGEYVGTIKHAADGALADGDRAIEIVEGDGHVKLPIGASLATARELAIELWISGASSGPILELRSTRTALRMARTGDKGDELRAAFVGADGKLVEMGSGGGKLDGAWHHVALTHDGTTGRLFLDGREIATVTTSLSLDAADVLYIGHRPAIDDAPPQALSGRIDEVAVYTRALVGKRFDRRRDAAKSGLLTNAFPVFSAVE